MKNEPPERGWRAELLHASSGLPAPFTAVEHEFSSLEQVRAWLGGAAIQNDGHGLPT